MKNEQKQPFPSNKYQSLVTALILAIMLIVLLVLLAERSQSPVLRANEPELAKYMAELQVLTHKLSLSIDRDNPELAEFYMYESMLLLDETKEDVPEYRKLPIAVLIEQLMEGQYSKLEVSLKKEMKSQQLNESKLAMAQLIESCNQCHNATQYGFIKITQGLNVNPFNQDFSRNED